MKKQENKEGSSNVQLLPPYMPKVEENHLTLQKARVNIHMVCVT